MNLCMYCKHQVFKRREYYCTKYKRRLKRNEKGSIYQLCRKDEGNEADKVAF